MTGMAPYPDGDTRGDKEDHRKKQKLLIVIKCCYGNGGRGGV
jgi:hypothetical protein